MLCPDTYGQGFKAVRKKFTISGSIGVPGVTLQGLPDLPQTNENGVYSAEVEYEWSGTVTPIKLGYTFVPNQMVYDKVKENKTDNYEPKPITFTISGSVGKPGVAMKGFPGDPVVSDNAGRYLARVGYEWSGTVVPEKPGFRFEPASLVFVQIRQNRANTDNCQAFDLKFVISGSAGAAAVTMLGLSGNPKSLADGTYRAEVPWGWSGTVKPTKEGHTFTPEQQVYSNTTQDRPNETYSAQVLSFRIPISAGMSGVTLEGLPGDPVTDETGSYTAVVEYGVSGKVTPKKPGYTFDPLSKTFSRVTADMDTVTFNSTPIQLTISGNVGIAGVVMSGLPGSPTSDNVGFYSAKVEFEWSGIVTPQKDGYSFDPAEKPYSAVTQDQLNQTYKASRITCQISGNVGQGGVALEGLPGRIVSSEDGSYSVEVDYRWGGKVTPKKAGYTFDPPVNEYVDVTTPWPAQDYTARIIQYTISGRVVMADGRGLEGVSLFADNDGGNATTDSNGAFQLQVGHGWQGRLTVQRDGYTINPPIKAIEAVLKDISLPSFSGSVKMMTITDSIIFDDEPIQGVLITAQPGGYKATTDAGGKYTIQVPYDWAGELFPTKPGFDFNPPSVSYANVTVDIDKTVPEGTSPTPVPGPGPTYTPPVNPDVPPVVPDRVPDTTPPQPGPDKSPSPGVNPTLKNLLLTRLAEIKNQIITPPTGPNSKTMAELIRDYTEVEQMLRDMGVSPDEAATPPGPNEPSARIVEPGRGQTMPGPLGTDLIEALTKLAEQKGAKIAVDATVKPEPVQFGAISVQDLSVSMALDKILSGTATPNKYRYEQVEANTYQVFHPVTNTYPGVDILQALQDLAQETGIPIIPDANVTGDTYASYDNVPLERALTMILAGTPFVFQRTPHFYVVADRGPKSPGFMDVSRTRHVWVNNRSPAQIKAILPAMYGDYVQAEAASTTDPNDLGHLLTITAPATIADQIMALIKSLDLPRRQVLLDARVVVMERGNMLNLGVEWQFPTLQAGQFLADHDWHKGVRIGYSSDQSFTDSLMATLNMLEATNQADIVAHPQLISQDGRQAQLRSIQEEWFMMSDQTTAGSAFGYSRAELQKIESGTVLTITPRVGDSNDIELEMAVEVSDSIPRGADSSLPIVTRRIAKNSVSVQDGGTVAVAGLTENRGRQVDKRVPFFGSIPVIGEVFKNRDHNKASREVAVFVTAHIVRAPDLVANGSVTNGQAPGPERLGIGSQVQPAGPEYTESLADALRRRAQ